MKAIKKMKKVKLIIGMLYSDKNLFEIAKMKLIKYFGKIDYESKPILFNYTDYYNKEMGIPIFRVYISFEKLIFPYKLGKIKLITNKIEDSLKSEKGRKVNIDPGTLSLSNLILATTKNYSHRIPISKRIYGEVTLIYRNKRFNDLEWTYPDYKDDKNKQHFLKIREIYKNQIKQ